MVKILEISVDLCGFVGNEWEWLKMVKMVGMMKNGCNWWGMM